ncbi:MAG: hypothetical protein AAF704_16600, partial [Cyanobacteria bacterium P01_D01_bin.123]
MEPTQLPRDWIAAQDEKIWRNRMTQLREEFRQHRTEQQKLAFQEQVVSSALSLKSSPSPRPDNQTARRIQSRRSPSPRFGNWRKTNSKVSPAA